MTDLDDYLAQHFLTEGQLATAAAISLPELDALISADLLPQPSYVVGNDGTVRSFLFGELAAPGSTPGSYFPPANLAWIALAREALAYGTAQEAHQLLKEQFMLRFAAALATLNHTTWRLPDCFTDHGAPIATALRARADSAWTYFLNGTYGLCVANPVSEAHIACKEVLQEKLERESDSGRKALFTPRQVVQMHELIGAYAALCAPFSPVDYPFSSRKRLVDDLRAAILAATPPVRP